MKKDKLLRVELEYADRIISLEGKEAEEWNQIAQGMAVMSWVHGGIQKELKWKIKKKKEVKKLPIIE